jgi:L-lactate dehydrogenase complex protein LldF
MSNVDYVRQEHHEFLAASEEALHNPNLRRILSRLGDTLGRRNREAWQLLPGSDDVRERARSIKDATLADLAAHLGTLADSVARVGGRVWWAEDGEEACRVILDIVRGHKATRVVKSKSMTSEEIHLNKALIKAGIQPTETDFGEYIIQVAGHRPSHIVGPALHLSASDVAEILSPVAGEKLPAEREALAAFARRKLRRHFAEAEIGITGANFAVAETGTIVLVSNEGNARLATSLPPVLIAVMGIEKVIPRLADLPPLLKVLARAATGQKLSVYTSFVTGTRQADELDGPRELHLVILDNGRSRVLAGPLRESLFCIRCGACLNVCPIYRNVGGHAYGGVYAGPIGAVLTPLYDGLAANEHLPQASSLCGACQAACPVKIAIPELLIRLREKLQSETNKTSWLERLAYKLWTRLLGSPWWYGAATWLATRTIGRLYRSRGWMSRLPGKLSGWTERRDFPAPAAERFRDWWRREGQHGTK